MNTKERKGRGEGRGGGKGRGEGRGGGKGRGEGRGGGKAGARAAVEAGAADAIKMHQDKGCRAGPYMEI